MSEALYRKYRPQTFDDVVGQTHIERTLKNAIEQDKVGHAYLFCGPRGTGKTTTARLLAKALLCEKGPTPSPDGTCEQCEAIANGVHPDVYELDAASRTGVDNVREEIIGRVQYAPTRGRYKVYIIDEVHMLSKQAFNALLKTFEEPPAHVVFIMCTTDPQVIPETILSRCQRFDFHRLSTEEIVSRLGAVCVAEDVSFEGDALDLIAHRAQGGMRDALTMLEQLIAFGGGQVSVEVANNMLGALDVDDMSEVVRHIANRDAAACFTWVSEYVETGADLARFARDLAAYVRDLYVLSLTDGAVAVNAAQSVIPRMTGEARMFGVDRLAYMLRVLGDLNTELNKSTNPRLSFEIALTRMVRPQSDLTLESLAARVEVLERALASGQAGSAAVAAAPAVATAPTASVPAMGNAGYKQAPSSVPATPASPASASSSAEAENRAAQFKAQLQARRAQNAAAQASVAPQQSVQCVATPAASAPVAAPQQSAQRAAAPVVSAPVAAPQPVTQPAQQPAAPVAAPQPSAQAQAVASASAPMQPAASAANTPAAASDDVKAKLLNPASLQRGWQTALADVKRQRAAYGALLLSAHIVANPDGSGIAIEFSQSNTFAYSAAQKPDVSKVLEGALAAAFGGPVPFRVTQASSAASAPAVPAQPAVPARQFTSPQPAAAQASFSQAAKPAAPAQPQRSAAASASAAPQAPASAPQVQAPAWQDEVVPYSDADIAGYVSSEEAPPFGKPDAAMKATAPSHQENADRLAAAPNPFANLKKPEGLPKRADEVQVAPQEQAAFAKKKEDEKPKAARPRKSAAEKLAETVAQYGDAMLVRGAQPVDPLPKAKEIGFTCMPDPKTKTKGLVKPKGWPMPGDAELIKGIKVEAPASAEVAQGAQESQLEATPAPEPEEASAAAFAPEPEPAYATMPPSSNNPFANRARPQAANAQSQPAEPTPAASASGEAAPEPSIDDICRMLGIDRATVREES